MGAVGIFGKHIKGQIISKDFWCPRILPKNEQTNSFLLLKQNFLFVFVTEMNSFVFFWKNLRIPKSPFEII